MEFMNLKCTFFSNAGLFVCLIVLIFILSACSFCSVNYVDPICFLKNNNPPSLAIAGSVTTVFEDPQTIIVLQGNSCSQKEHGGGVLNVRNGVQMPSYVTNATVFLNGWRLEYLNDDHHVAGLGTLIDSIRLQNNSLSWYAQGAISDKNFDDPYYWCYNYTIIGWNSSNLNLVADDNDGNCRINNFYDDNYFSTDNAGTTTALSSFPSFLYNAAFISNNTVAILPRGFAFEWAKGCEDHHLLQIGYNLDHSETIIEKKPYKKDNTEFNPPISSLGLVDSGYVSWNTYTIYKDNSTRRNYHFGELVSGIGGKDVRIIQPPFSILPSEDGGNCIETNAVIQSHDYTINNIPYKYAIPVLTGWELHNVCDDHHVRDIGVWIDKWSYTKNGNSTGSLTYTLSYILKDNSSSNAVIATHNVAVLGIQPEGEGSVENSDGNKSELK